MSSTGVCKLSGELSWRRIHLMGVPLDNLTMNEAVDAIMEALRCGARRKVFFVNAHCVNVAYQDSVYRDVLRRADLVLADGIGLKLAGVALRTPLRDNVNGTDLFPRLCEALQRAERSMFLLGARAGVAERVRLWVNRHYPDLVVKGCHHGYFGPAGEAVVIEKVAEAAADVLLVALGVPYQELWIDRHFAELGVTVAMGVGGLFDFYSGRIRRAPRWMRRSGLEWLYRLAVEPRRLARRYVLGNPLFLGRVALRALGRGSAGAAARGFPG